MIDNTQQISKMLVRWWPTSIGWNISWLKSLYDDVRSAVIEFFYQWDPSNVAPIEEVCDRNGDYVEKSTMFGHIPLEYLGQLKNFLIDPPG